MRPLIALVLGPALLAAQSPPRPLRLEPGARVRFDAPTFGGQLTGTLVAWKSDTLIVEVDGDAAGLGLIVPMDSVAQIDVRRERRMTLDYAGIGLLGGTLLALIASPDWVDENGNCTTPGCLAYKVSPHLDTRLAVFGIGGALLGTIIGSETKTARWVPVHVQRLNIAPMPDGGFALGVRLSF